MISFAEVQSVFAKVKALLVVYMYVLHVHYAHLLLHGLCYTYDYSSKIKFKK